MIRNVVVHLANEQPLMADMFAMPTPTDVALVCTNLRDMNGKRPIFVDDPASYFVFPLTFVRFVEIPPASLRDSGTMTEVEYELPSAAAGEPSAAEGAPDAELEIDEDFLRRVRDI
jgi:hypothetical protein